MVHERCDGCLNEGDPTKLTIVVGMNDGETKARAAQHLHLGQFHVDGEVIDRPLSDALSHRPEALSG